MTSATGDGVGRNACGDVSPGLAAAVTFTALYLVHALALRIADTAILLDSGAASITALGPPISLPFLLGEELVVGAALSAVLWAAWRRPLLRAIWLAALGAYLLFLAGDQLAFKSFFTHVDYVLYEDCNDVAGLLGSIVGSFDGFFYADAALAVACVVAVAAPYRPRIVLRAARRIASRPVAAGVGCALYLGLSIGLSIAAEQHGLDRPFPVAFAESYLAARAEQAAEQRARAVHPPTPATADRRAVDADPSTDELARIRRALAAYPGKLNVVWYMMESTSFRETTLDPAQRYDTTPFLKRLAADSVLFTRYHTGVAASTRAYFSVLTGLDPYMDLHSDMTKYSQLAAPTLVDVLHDAGWATAFFASSDTMFESLDTFLAARKYDAFMDKNLLPLDERAGMSMSAWGVDEEIMIDKALEWVSATRASGRPYFLSYNAVVPHHPFSVPPQHRGLYDMDWGEKLSRARYRASLRYADTALERMYDALGKLGALDDTLFIVTPDHGEAFGDLHRKNSMHAEYCYEEDSRIFLLLHNPKVLGAPLVTARLGSHVDMFPTLLEALGVRKELDVDGRSLIAASFAQPTLHCFSRRQLAIRHGDLKAITARDEDEIALYDLAADPDEQRDLAASRPEEAESYEAEILGWKAESAARLRTLVARSGLSDDAIAARAAAARMELFSGVRLLIATAAICPSSGAASCAASGAGRRFARGKPLSAWVRLQKTGQAGLKLEIFDPKGKRIYARLHKHEAGIEATLGEVPGELLQVPGSYKARVSIVRSYAIHDARLIPFVVQ